MRKRAPSEVTGHSLEELISECCAEASVIARGVRREQHSRLAPQLRPGLMGKDIQHQGSQMPGAQCIFLVQYISGRDGDPLVSEIACLGAPWLFFS